MKSHQKMCWNCDGHVHVYEMQCPYCGADLTKHEETEKEYIEEEFSEPTTEEFEERKTLVEEPEEEDPPFQSLIEDEERLDLQEEEEAWEKSPKSKEEPDLDNPLASLILLLPGSLFFIFGLSLFLFSKEGFLTFHFRAKYWFVYLLGSWPLLYLGWRSLFPKEPASFKSKTPSSR